MHRNYLRSLLKKYQQRNPYEEYVVHKFEQFIENFTNCFDRNLEVGHITASGWLLNPDQDAAFLVHHKKLNKWVQTGGHVDGSPDVLNEAVRETREESGINEITPLSADIFDLDVHVIPARKGEPEHFHYDVRFLLQAHTENFCVNSESVQGSWVPLHEVKDFTYEDSVLRMAQKSLGADASTFAGLVDLPIDNPVLETSNI